MIIDEWKGMVVGNYRPRRLSVFAVGNDKTVTSFGKLFYFIDYSVYDMLI